MALSRSASLAPPALVPVIILLPIIPQQNLPRTPPAQVVQQAPLKSLAVMQINPTAGQIPRYVVRAETGNAGIRKMNVLPAVEVAEGSLRRGTKVLVAVAVQTPKAAVRMPARVMISAASLPRGDISVRCVVMIVYSGRLSESALKGSATPLGGGKRIPVRAYASLNVVLKEIPTRSGAGGAPQFHHSIRFAKGIPA